MNVSMACIKLPDIQPSFLLYYMQCKCLLISRRLHLAEVPVVLLEHAVEKLALFIAMSI